MCFNDTAEQLMSGGLDNSIKVMSSLHKDTTSFIVSFLYLSLLPSSVTNIEIMSYLILYFLLDCLGMGSSSN